MKEKYLPVGTVVTLNGATKRIMIIGYCPMAEGNKVFDYSACTYPEGIISADKTLAFNHDQINTINFMGLEDQEQAQFNLKIKNMLGNLENLKNIQLPNNNQTSNPQPAMQTPVNEVPTLDINQ